MSDGAASPVPNLELDWGQVAAAVFAAHGITSGFWRIGVKLQFAGITGAWDADGQGTTMQLPTALTGINGLALWSVPEPGPMVFDASQLSATATAEAKTIRSAGRKRRPSA